MPTHGGDRNGSSGTPRPAPVAVIAENVPESLRRLDRWVCWSWEWNPKKDGGKCGRDKPPYDVRTGRNASSTNPATWASFADALAAHRAGLYDGIGFALGEDGATGAVYSGLDLDDCRDPDTGRLSESAVYYLRLLDTYSEVSPSRTGAKAIAVGRLPKGRRDNGRGVEMYDSGRYFTVTGWRLDGFPADVMERTEALARVHATAFTEARAAGKQAHLSDRELTLSALAGLSTRRAAGYSDWLAVGMALHCVDPSEAMLAEWDRWSQGCADKYEEGACATKWRSFTAGGGLTLGSLIHWARQDGWAPPTGPPSGAKGAEDRSGRRSAKADTVPATALGRPRRLPPAYRPFPLECLAAPMSLYVRDGAKALGCDAAYLALPALSVAAGLIGYTRVVRLKRTWKAPSVLWTMVIADSGSLKTPAFRLATDYLFTLQHRLDAELLQELDAYLKEKEEWPQKVKQAAEAKEEPPPKPEPPRHQTTFTSDATIEAIAELISDNPRGLIVACDELAAWLGSFARYKNKGAGSDVQRWLSMHSAGGFAYHRRTGDKRRIVVPHAAISVCGGIQPGVLAQAMGEEFLASGLAARLLMAMPPRPAKKWTELDVAPEVERSYHSMLDGLFALDHARDKTGKPVPHVLKLDPDAKAAWVDWYDAWGQEQEAAEGELASALAKLEEAAARFALVHHVVTHVGLEVDDLRPLGHRSMEAGISLARWFAAEGRRVYAALAETSAERDARRLVEFIEGRGGRITERELQRANGRKYPTSEAAREALTDLAVAGLGRWVDGPTPASGGHTVRYLELLSDVRQSDTRPTLAPDGRAAIVGDSATSHSANGTYVGNGVRAGERVSDCRTSDTSGECPTEGRVSDGGREPGEEG
jgi:hypothetical protein